MKQLQNSLEPMRLILREQPFLGGKNPNFADLAVAGYFAVCPILFFDPVSALQSPVVFVQH